MTDKEYAILANAERISHCNRMITEREEELVEVSNKENDLRNEIKQLKAKLEYLESEERDLQKDQ